MQPCAPRRQRRASSPEPERLKIEGDWKDAAKKLVQPKPDDADQEPDEEAEEPE